MKHPKYGFCVAKLHHLQYGKLVVVTEVVTLSTALAL